MGVKPNIHVPPGMRVRMVPLLSWTQAGTLVDFSDEPYSHEAVPAFDVSDPHAFALIVRGDSMEPEIREGNRVVVCPGLLPRTGDVVIARTKRGEVMCKLYQGRDKSVVFSSYNPAYPPIELARSEVVWIYPVQSVTKDLRRD